MSYQYQPPQQRASSLPQIVHPRPIRPTVGQILLQLDQACRTPRPSSASPAPYAPTVPLSHHQPDPPTAPTPIYAPTPADTDLIEDISRLCQVIHSPPSAAKTRTFMNLVHDLSSKFEERGWMDLVFVAQDMASCFDADDGSSYVQVPVGAALPELSAADLHLKMPPTPDTWGGQGYVTHRLITQSPLHFPLAPSPASTLRSYGESAYDGDMDDDGIDSDDGQSRTASRFTASPATFDHGEDAFQSTDVPDLTYSSDSSYRTSAVTTPDFDQPKHYDPQRHPGFLSRYSTLAYAVQYPPQHSRSSSSASTSTSRR